MATWQRREEHEPRDRSTRVNTAPCPLPPRSMSPSQCPGTARSSASAGRAEIRMSSVMPSVTRSRHRSGACGAAVGLRCAVSSAELTLGPHEQRLVDRLVRHPHPQIAWENTGSIAAICSGDECPATAPNFLPHRPVIQPPCLGLTGLLAASRCTTSNRYFTLDLTTVAGRTRTRDWFERSRPAGLSCLRRSARSRRRMSLSRSLKVLDRATRSSRTSPGAPG